MARVLILYYSSYGHVEQMAQSVAEGVREGGGEADVRRVPELVPADIARKSGFKLEHTASLATVDEMADYDAIVIGVGTRFGRMASQMANFLDQAGGLWAKGALHGKVGGAFTSTATQHGGQETTLFSIITNLLHSYDAAGNNLIVIVGAEERENAWVGEALAEHAAISTGQVDLVLRQGHEMGRPCRITVQLRKENEVLVHGGIGGHAVIVAEGVLDLGD